MAESDREPPLCPCGFWGSPSTSGLCSKCYKEMMLRNGGCQMTMGSTVQVIVAPDTPKACSNGQQRLPTTPTTPTTTTTPATTATTTTNNDKDVTTTTALQTHATTTPITLTTTPAQNTTTLLTTNPPLTTNQPTTTAISPDTTTNPPPITTTNPPPTTPTNPPPTTTNPPPTITTTNPPTTTITNPPTPTTNPPTILPDTTSSIALSYGDSTSSQPLHQATTTASIGTSTDAAPPPPCTTNSATLTTIIHTRSVSTETEHKPKRRCQFCKARLPLTSDLTGRCKCDGIFCDKHRLPEQHACPFDHKAVGRREAKERMVSPKKHVGTSLKRLDSDS